MNHLIVTNPRAFSKGSLEMKLGENQIGIFISVIGWEEATWQQTKQISSFFYFHGILIRLKIIFFCFKSNLGLPPKGSGFFWFLLRFYALKMFPTVHLNSSTAYFNILTFSDSFQPPLCFGSHTFITSVSIFVLHFIQLF